MVVWDDSDGADMHKALVCGIVSNRSESFRVLTDCGAYEHCAEIPEPQTVTERELAQWLAQGNGEMRYSPEHKTCYSHSSYLLGDADKPVTLAYVVRAYKDTEWHSPTRKYLGLED